MSMQSDAEAIPTTVIEPVTDLRDRLLQRLPDTIHRIVLYGSYARGEARTASDLDVLVVLSQRNFSDYDEIRKIRYSVMEKYDYEPLISLLLLSEDDWGKLSQRSAGLKSNIDREGITVWVKN